MEETAQRDHSFDFLFRVFSSDLRASDRNSGGFPGTATEARYAVIFESDSIMPDKDLDAEPHTEFFRAEKYNKQCPVKNKKNPVIIGKMILALNFSQVSCTPVNIFLAKSFRPD